MSSKQMLLKFIQGLPDNSTFDDIENSLYEWLQIQEIRESFVREEYFTQEDVNQYIREKIERGLEASRRGEVITQEEFEKEMNEWSIKSFGRSLL